MSLRTSPAGVLALLLAMHLPGGLSSAVLCMHHDGDVTIERAEPGGLRCDDARTPCVPPGLGATGEEHCHDAAIAQPGLGQRVVAIGALVPTGFGSVVVSGRLSRVSGALHAGTPTLLRRTIVLRV